MYIESVTSMYTSHMEVGVADLRSHLKRWLEAARSGEDIVITDRGTPVARLIGVDTSPLLERLAEEGVISRAPGRRPEARGRRRVRARGSVSELVSDQRD